MNTHMKTERQITKAIMRRVWGIYFMRLLGRPVTRVTAFSAILLAITSSVSMPNIIANASHSSNVLTFVLAAVADTNAAVQLGILFAGMIVAWSVFDIFRSEPGEARISAY